MFVWVAGIELDLGEAWQRRRETGVTAGLALAVPLVTGSIAAAVMLRYPGWAGPSGARWQVILGIGMACAVTALPILVLFLEKLEVLREPIGQRILRYASLDDIAIWGVLALILLDWERVGRQGAFLVGFALATVIVRRLMARIPERDRWYVSLIWLAGCGFAADWAGLHFMVGAFLSGAVLDAKWFDQKRMDDFRYFVLLAVMPVFFLSTGLKTQWAVGGVAVFAAAALLLLAADGTIAGWSTWAAIVILCREILVSGLREYLAELKVSVPVTRLAKWKTATQMVAIGFLLAGPAGDLVMPYVTKTGITLLWVAAIITLYTGYDYFRAGLRHIDV